MVRRSFVRALLALLFICVPAVGNASADDLEKGLGRDLRESRATVARATAKLRAGETPASEIAHLKSIADNVRAAHLLMQERFRLRGEKAAAQGGKAALRQNAVAANYTKAIDDYLALIDALPPDNTVTQSSLDALKSLLDRIITTNKRPIIGALPYKHPGYPPREPAAAPAVVPAYRGGNRDVSAADTAASAEAPISKEIAELAQSLNWNPVLIYEWVKNNVETEWYWGVMKGAEETLRQKSGNDADQAALLTALLRASGYPSRFVRGTIEFFPDIDKVKNLTGLTDPVQIAAFFRKAGIAFKPVIAGGSIANFQVEHIWVESRIPYANYRGAVIDDQGKTWLGLDTSIKPLGYTRNTPLDVPADVTASMRDDYLSASQDKTPLEFLQGKVKEYLDANQPGKAWQDALQNRAINPDVLNIIPASLQFKAIAITGEYTELPAELRHQVKFTAGAKGSELFSITLDTLKLSNKRVTLTYEPETVEDQQIIDSYGGLDNTPSYLVRLRPVLTLDGERQIVGGDGLPMGAEYPMIIDVVTPNGTETITSAQITGNLTAIGIVGGKAAAPGPVAESDNAETLLHKEAISYIDRWNRAEDELAAFYRVAPGRPLPAVVIVGGLIDVTSILDTPHDFQWKGVFIDAALRGIEVTGASGETWREKEFMRLSSLQGSVLENRIFEDDFKVESISTAKLLHLAGVDATPLVNMDKTKVDTVLPALPFDDNVKADIANAVNQGLTVTIPQSEIGYQDWTGIGYVKENPETGEAGWMLTGMVAGGMSVVGIDRWNEIFKDDLSEPYSEPPNRDPESGVSIQKITVTDLQFGDVGEPVASKLQVMVKDLHGKPVEKAPVTFTVIAGGGTLEGGQTTKTVKTDKTGIASIGLTLGKITADNPVFISQDGDTYFRQYGANIVDAALGSGTTVTAPFTAYGMPKEAENLRQIYGDGNIGMVLSFAGFVSLAVEDTYGNPIADQPVKFAVGQATDKSGCTEPGADTRPAILVENEDPCLKNSPTYSGISQCKTAAPSITVNSNIHGASVEVIMGAIPGGEYPINATAKVKTASGDKELSTTFTLHTYYYNGICASDHSPIYSLSTTYVFTADMSGRSVNAGKSGSDIPVLARMYYIKEEEKEINRTISCGDSSSITCKYIVGARKYFDSTDFKSAQVTFGDTSGEPQGDGLYKASYTLKPGLNKITITGKADIIIHESANSCSGCGKADETVSPQSQVVVELYGVDLSFTQPEKLVAVIDKNGYSQQDMEVHYGIAPADYRAYSAVVLVYKGDEIVEAMPTETQGAGFAVISRGFKFEQGSAYSVQTVLNMGSGVEIKSDRYPISFKMPGFNLERIDMLSRFDSSVPVPELYTDSYKTFDFTLEKPASVSVDILDVNFVKQATLVGRTDLAAGEHHFVTDYGQIFNAGFSPALAPGYMLQVTEDFGGDTPPRKLLYAGVMSERTTGRMLGQVMVHDVLIQDGSLNLTRQDFAFTGRGPRLDFSRSYTNQSTSTYRQVMGNGWSHSLDMRLQPMGRRGSGAGSVPDWVKNNEGKFFGDIPTDPPYWTSVSVNGAVFKENNGVWYAERGRHGSLALTGGEYVYTSKDGTKYFYDYPQMDPTPVKRITDRNGNTTTFSYDSFKRLDKVIDAVNRSCEFRYDNLAGFIGEENSRLMSVTCSDGIEVDFKYNAQGYLVSARRGDRVETYDYALEAGIIGAPYNLVKTTDSNQHSFKYEYYGIGQIPPTLGNYVKALKAQDVVKSVTYPDNKPALFAYDTQTANKRIVTDMRGKDTTYTLNYFGNPLKIEEPLDATNIKTTLMTWSIDENKPDNVMTSKTDPLGYATYYEYDGQGNIAKETDPYDKSIITSWNQAFSLPESRKDRNNFTQTQTWQYDPHGNLLTHTDGDGKKYTYTYFDTGEKKTAVDPLGYTTSYTYDNYGNPASESGAEGSVTRYQYDIRGRRTALTDPNNRTTQYTYDNLDHPATVVYPAHSSYSLADGSGNTKTTVYDKEGNLLTETDRTGLTQTYTYTGRNQVKTIARNAGGTKSFDYDGNGNLLSESDWKGVPTTHVYDDLNRRISTTNRMGHTAFMGYDLSGNLTSETDAEGRVTTHAYDKLNRLTDTWQPALDGEQPGNLHYTYYDEADPKTNLKTETDQENHTTTYEYNGRYLRTRRLDARPGGFQGIHLWEYDDNGNLAKETDEEGRVTTNGYDKQNRLTATTRTVGGSDVVTRFQYDPAGNRTHVTDANNHDTETRYDEWNRPWQVIDPDRYVTTTELDGEGRDVKTIDGNGNIRTKTRDQRGLVLTSTDAENNISRYTYDDNGNNVTITDAKGVVTRTGYDAEDKKLLTVEAEGTPEERTSGVVLYDKVENPVQVRDYNGNVKKTDYNALNLPAKVYDPAPFDNLYTETAYYKTGKVKTVTDRRKNATAYEYDELNRVVKVTDPLSQTIVTTYDKVGNVKTLTDKRTIVTENDYDELNRLKEKRRAGLRLVTNEYDGVGNLRFVTDANGNRTENQYNKRNLLETVIHPDTTTEKKIYDGVGNLLTDSDEEQHVTTYTYDKENRQTSVELAGEKTDKLYDPVGNLIAVIKPEANSRTMVYDHLKRLTAVTEGSLTTRYEYDANGNLRHQYDPRGNDVEYVWDVLNRKTALIQHKGTGDLVDSYGYDEEGNLTSQTDAKGQQFSYSFDKLNRKTDETNPAQATPYLALTGVHTDYDGNNNVIGITETKVDTGGATVTDTTTNTYDDFDRLKTSDTRGVTVSYDYDNNGNRTSVGTGSGSTAYTFDSRNRVKTAVASAKTTSFDYYPDGKTKQVSYPNGAAIAYTYHPTNRVKTVVNTGAGNSAISSFAYEYDRNGNRTSQIEIRAGSSETTAYSYDMLDRLQSFTVSDGSDTTTTDYTFEGYNRASESVKENSATVTTRSYSYDETDWLMNVQVSNAGGDRTINYTYDKNGNTVKKQDTSETEDVLYDYDASNQLVRAMKGTSLLGLYDYNSEGLRIRHHNGDRGDVDYWYDGKAVIEEQKASGGLLAHYRYAGKPLSLVAGGENQYYHFDGLGSTVNLTNSAGVQQAGYFLDPWGHIKEEEGDSVNRQIFTGQEHDENTGLIYFGARYYDPDTARFITEDSYMGDKGTPPSLNRYLYAYSNPTVYIDLEGYDAVEVNKKGDVYWDVQKDIIGPFNPTQRKIFIGKMTKGGVQLTQEMGGGLVTYNNLKKAAKIFWNRAGTESVMNQADISGYKPEYQNQLIRCYLDDILNPHKESRARSLPEESYLKRSSNQVIKGNYSKDVTLLGTAGQIATGILGLDLPGDIRDMNYDIKHWDNSLGHAGQTALDTIGLLPVVGVVKYTKVVKQTSKNDKKIAQNLVKDLLAGKDVEVGSIKEADALLKEALPNATKVKGAGPRKPDFEAFKGKKTEGMYHKDYLIDSETKRVYGHDMSNTHANFKHINVKLPDGSKATIKITPNMKGSGL